MEASNQGYTLLVLDRDNHIKVVGTLAAIKIAKVTVGKAINTK